MPEAAQAEVLEASEDTSLASETAGEVVEFDLEETARKAGWSPKDEWRGPEDGWKPAGEFLTETAITAKEIRAEMRSLRKELSVVDKTTKQFVERAKAQAIKDAETRIREMTELNDVDGVMEASRDLVKAEAMTASQPGNAAEQFAADNPWFLEDEIARGIAVGAADKAAKLGKSEEAQLAAALAEVRKRMPELFDDAPAPRQQQRAPILGAGNRTPASNRKPGPVDLPASAQKAGRALIDAGMCKDMTEYADNWFKFNGKQ